MECDQLQIQTIGNVPFFTVSRVVLQRVDEIACTFSNKDKMEKCSGRRVISGPSSDSSLTQHMVEVIPLSGRWMSFIAS